MQRVDMNTKNNSVITYRASIILLFVTSLAIHITCYGNELRLSPNSPGRNSLGTQHTISTNQNSNIIYHNYYERGNGPTVILLPSLGRPASDFNELTTFLSSSGFKTIAIDLNQSTNNNSKIELNLFQMADQVDELIGSLSLKKNERVFVVGHAFGNRLARAYATKYTKKVNSVVLLAAGGKVDIAPDIKLSMKQSFDPKTSYLNHYKAVKHAFFSNKNTIPTYWLIGWNPTLAMAQVYATLNTDYSTWWSAGGVPILVIQGNEDAIAPSKHTSELLKSEYGDKVQVILVSPAGHALLPEKPDLINKAVSEFINKQLEIN